MSEQKKNKVNVRDLKPTKDAKGGQGAGKMLALSRDSNHFTSARVAVLLTAARPGKWLAFVSKFSVPSKKFPQ